jgi:ABC-type Fe3+-siderophore transport system permease subunit
MKRIIFYLIIIVMASSCSMFKRSSTEINKESLTSTRDFKKNTNTSLDSIASENYLSLNKISDQSAYQIKLWPKGQIVYHSMDNFEGEFDSIKISGNLNKHGIDATVSSKNNSLKKAKTALVSEYAELKTDRKIKTKQRVPDIIAMIILVISLSISTFLIIKYLKKKVRS